MKIFVVENHDDTRTYLVRFLEQCGHTVVSTSAVEETLHHPDLRDADVLISDIGLPDGSGWELLERMPVKPYGIAMSGFGSAADLRRSREVGFRHHLVKPFLPTELVGLLMTAESGGTSGNSGGSDGK